MLRRLPSPSQYSDTPRFCLMMNKVYGVLRMCLLSTGDKGVGIDGSKFGTRSALATVTWIALPGSGPQHGPTLQPFYFGVRPIVRETADDVVWA